MTISNSLFPWSSLCYDYNVEDDYSVVFWRTVYAMVITLWHWNLICTRNYLFKHSYFIRRDQCYTSS